MKNFLIRRKSLCGIFCGDTLTLVTPEDRRGRCEQLVNRMALPFPRCFTRPAADAAQRGAGTAGDLPARRAWRNHNFHRLTEVTYAPTSLPTLVFLHHSLPIAFLQALRD